MPLNTNLLKDLVLINLIQANPALWDSMKRKSSYASNPNRLLKGYAFSLVVKANLFNAMIFILLFMQIDFKSAPGFLDMSLVLCICVSVLQNLSAFYNILFEDRSFKDFFAFPIERRTLYLGKILSILLASFGNFFMLFAPLMHFYRCNLSLPVGILGGSILGLLFWMVENLLSVAFVFLVVRSPHAKKLISLGSTLSLIVYCVFLAAFSVMKNRFVFAKTPYLLSSRLLAPSGFLLVSGCLILMIVLLTSVSLKTVSLSQAPPKTDVSGRRFAYRTPKSFSGALLAYNRSLLKRQVIFINSILTPVLMPVLILLPTVINLSKKTTSFSPLHLALATGFALPCYISVFPTVLPSVIISLEGPDHLLLRSLPVPQAVYYRAKLKTVFLYYNVLPLCLLAAGLFFLGVPVHLTLLSLLISAVLCTGFNRLWLMFDAKHLCTDWNAEIELFSRLPKGLGIVIFMAGFFAGGLSIALLFLKSALMPYVITGVTLPTGLYTHLKFRFFLRKAPR